MGLTCRRSIHSTRFTNSDTRKYCKFAAIMYILPSSTTYIHILCSERGAHGCIITANRIETWKYYKLGNLPLAVREVTPKHTCNSDSLTTSVHLNTCAMEAEVQTPNSLPTRLYVPESSSFSFSKTPEILSLVVFPRTVQSPQRREAGHFVKALKGRKGDLYLRFPESIPSSLGAQVRTIEYRCVR